MGFQELAAWYSGHAWYVAIVLFLLGLCLGSFLNVCIYRIPNKLSIRTPPSHCPDCKARLTAIDLVPVFSWLFLRGKCRHCGKKISPRYLCVELLTGVLFVICWWQRPELLKVLPALTITCVLLISAFIDAEHSIIPNGVVLFGAAAGLILDAVYWGITGHMPWQNASVGHIPWNRALSSALVGVLAGGAPLVALDMLSRMVLRKDGMGGGDVKLMAMAGLYLGGTASLVALLLAVIAGGFTGAVLLIAKRLKRGDYFPFGPFLAAGAFASMLFSGNLLQLYAAFNAAVIKLWIR